MRHALLEPTKSSLEHSHVSPVRSQNTPLQARRRLRRLASHVPLVLTRPFPARHLLRVPATPALLERMGVCARSVVPGHTKSQPETRHAQPAWPGRFLALEVRRPARHASPERPQRPTALRARTAGSQSTPMLRARRFARRVRRTPALRVLHALHNTVLATPVMPAETSYRRTRSRPVRGSLL